MEKLSMCRICLSTDARMHLLVDTHLQKMYEDLTAIPLVTKDNRPTLACYICCARLKNCYQLRIRCLQSEKLFTQILANNVSVPDKQEGMRCSDSLKITPVIHLSMGEVLNSVVQSADYEIKKEIPEVEVIVKRENPEDSGEESLQEYYMTLEDNIQSSDSEDFIILDAAPEKSRLVAQRGDLEETSITLDVAEDNSEKNDTTSMDNKNETGYNKENFKFDRYKNFNKPNKKTNLSKHNYKLTGENRYECETCYKSFSSNKNIRRHIRMHIGDTPYKCHICLKSFRCNNSLKTHIRVHTGEKPYKCETCKNFYSTKGSLRRHIFLKHTRNPTSTNKINNHTDLKVFTCDICKKGFTGKGNIISHMRTHTGEKPYKCNVCKKSFSERSTLNKHIIIHCDEKPFQCDKCDKGYKRKSHLDTHIRSHSGDRPYKCDVCHKGFYQKVHLTDHIRVHTGEKPFSCELCDYCFSHKSCLNRHMTRAHDVVKRGR